MADPNWKKAQQKVQEAFKKYMDTRKDFYCKRFTDTFEAGGKIVQSQPSDMWFIYRGSFVICEIKSSEYKDKFYFKDIQPSQLAGARRVVAAGGFSIFLIVSVPSWQWHYVRGNVILEMKAAGDNGILWSQMTPIKLDAEVILQQMELL